ncbi:MAG: type IV secretory system conjugative DNA transfer family protein [Candidatus Competibacteraceae bacterium]|jgi:defect-in-organelle-trafficking protein DotC|nr:type IV secretory system conjugative DNA transfer family protein [Candidatus Competibacteraceae bacterium]
MHNRNRSYWAVSLAIALYASGTLADDGWPLADDTVADSAPADTAPISRYDQGVIRLDDIKAGRAVQQGDTPINPLRAQALKESAQAYGARGGLYARMREINQLLDAQAHRLDGVFPFAPLLLAHNVVPPVIQVGQDTVRKNNDRQLRFADAVFNIVSPAKLSLVSPDWRTYLYVQAARPEPPDETMLPDRSKSAEVALWERYVEKGWRNGIRQANRTFEVQLNRLERDLIGMARYRELLAKDMVTPPRITEELVGVTDLGNTLLINDRILEIKENIRFVSDNQRWTPYPTKPYKPGKEAPEINLRVLRKPRAVIELPPPSPQPVAPKWSAEYNRQR